MHARLPSRRVLRDAARTFCRLGIWPVDPFRFVLSLWLACLAAAVSAAPARADIALGKGKQVAAIGGVDLTVFTYRPAVCRPRLLLLVFHGVSRRAASYRNHATPLADRVCAIVVAPEFDRARFPRALYQYGGTTRETVGNRSIDLVPSLAAWARQGAGEPDLPIVLLGHSAGAQFLDRVAAFVSTGAAAIIVANPSTWVMPSMTVAAPYGLGNTGGKTDQAVRAYLAQPMTVLLGTADTGTKELAVSAAAMAQGPNRYARGLNVFRMAQELALSQGWVRLDIVGSAECRS